MEPRRLEQLRRISDDKRSLGAFSGMIFNQWVQCKDKFDLMELITKAIDVQIAIIDLIGVHDEHPELADNPAIPEEYPITCTMCSKKTTVLFKPTPGWPVYCKECYMKRNPKK